MRTTSQIIARRVGRIAFGVVLLVGVVHLIIAGGFDAARTIELTWFLAVLAGVGRVARRGAHAVRAEARSGCSPRA